MDARTAPAGTDRATYQRPMFRVPWPALVVALLALLLLTFIVPPAIFLLSASLHTTHPDGSFDQLTLKFYAQLFASPFFLESLWNTFVYAARLWRLCSERFRR